MRASPFVAGLVVVAMMSGCSTYRASRKTAVVGTWMAGAGVGLAGVLALVEALAGLCLAYPPDGIQPDRCQLAQLGFYTSFLVVVPTGLVLLAGGGAGMLAYPKRTPAEQARARDEAERAAAHAHAELPCPIKRSARLKRAQEITDLDQRTKALLAIPLCEPVPVQRLTPAESVPSPVINTQPAPPVTPPTDDQPAPPVTPAGTP